MDIIQVGGVNSRGEKWTISSDVAKKGIQNGEYEFYIVQEFQELAVSVSGREGEKKLIVLGPGQLHNLLEGLPDCP